MDNIDNLDEQKVSLPGAATGETENVNVLENLNIENINNNNNSCSSSNEIKNNTCSDNNNNNNNNNNSNDNNEIDSNDQTVIKDENTNSNLVVINENIENILNENQENLQEEQNEINKILANPITTIDDEPNKIPESGDEFGPDSVQIQIETVDTVITEAAAAVAAVEPTKSELNFLNFLATVVEQEEEDDYDGEGDEDGQDKPPIPLPTYCWEDLKRAKELGGYPWTHLYKEPLGPYDEPEIVIGLRTTPRVKKRVKQRLLSNGSPKTEKKLVIFHDSIPEIRCDYSQSDELDLNCRPVDLLDLHNFDVHPLQEDELLDEFKENFIVNESEVIPSTSTTITTAPKTSKSPLNSLKRIKFKKPPKPNLQCCQPLVDKIKVMADKHFHSQKPPASPKAATASGSKKKLANMKQVHLAEGIHIPLKEEQKILRLKESPRAGGREISSYVERQDSDDIIDNIKVEESPQTAKKSKKERKRLARSKPVPKSDALIQYIPLKPPKSEEDYEEDEEDDEKDNLDEPKIELAEKVVTEDPVVVEEPVQETEQPEEQEPTVAEIIAEETKKDPPLKAPRKKKEHVYEDIEDYIPNVEVTTNTPSPASLIDDNHESIKASLNKQDEQILNEIHHRSADTYLDESHEIDKFDSNLRQTTNQALLAPISSIDSTSSDEDKRSVLPTLSEEHSDCETVIENVETIEEPRQSDQHESIDIVEVENGEDDKEIVEIFKNKSILSDKSSLTRSPGSEKKVTFSQSTDETEESEVEHDAVQTSVSAPNTDETDLDVVSDIEPEAHDELDNSRNVTSNGTKPDNRWSNMGDHEYEPVGEPVLDTTKQQQNGKYNNGNEVGGGNSAGDGHNGDAVQKRRHSDASSTTSHERKLLRVPTEDEADDNLSAQEYQNQIEDRFFNNTPSTTSRTDNEVHTSQVDSSAIENLPLKREDRKRSSMMTSIQDKSRNMQSKLRNQAGKVRTKLRGTKSSKPSIPVVKIDSPVKVKERKKFKAPDFSKLKNINMPKFKKPDFKFPEFKKSISTQETTTTTPDNHKFVTVIEEETTVKTEPRTYEIETSTVESIQPAPVVFTLPVDIPPPIEVPAPVPTQEKKSRFSRPEMPKFNFADKFASLRALKKDKSVVVDDDIEDKDEPKEDLDKPAEAKKSRFSRPEMPKFNFADKIASYKSRDRSRSKSTERTDQREEPISALSDDEHLDFTEQKEQLPALSPPADEPITAPPVLEPQDAPVFMESTATSSSQPSTDPEPPAQVKKSRFTRPEFTRFNFSEKLASFRRSRSTDASQNKQNDDFDDDDDESIPPEKITTKKRFSKPELPKFKIPEKFSSLRLRRSKSFKESSPTSVATNETTVTSEPLSSDEQKSTDVKPTKKPLFDFDFSTYPRFLSKLKKQKKSDAATIDSKIKVEFPTMSKTAVRRMSLDQDNESGSYRPSNENEDINRGYREGSVEKRMRLDEIEAQERYQEEFSDEQKQLDEYDRENREIHEIAKSRYDQPLPVAQEIPHTHQKLERQESDWNSEDEKVLQWVKQKTAENKEFDQEDSDIHSDELDQFLKYSRDQQAKQREVTPYTNQETQSSGGSSGMLRGKGVIEEIDDDEFFLRKKGISQENIPINEYISSALREGLTDPINSLAQVGDYNAYYPNINTPSDKFNRSMESDEIEPHINQQTIDNYFGTFPAPSKPIRRQKKSYSIDSQEVEDQQVPRQYYPTDDTRGFYEHDHGEEEPPQLQQKTVARAENHQFNINMPPVAPKRRKKGKSGGNDDQDTNDVKPKDEGYIDEYFDRVSVHEVFTKQYVPPPRWAEGPSPDFNEIIVHQTQHEYKVPLADVESFKSSPYPTPRTRSRSHLTDDDRTSHGADSLTSDNMLPIEEPPCKISSDPRDAHGYAIIRKDAPPRPPAPLRRKKSTQSLTIESKFSTMPMSKQQYEPSTPPPSRPNRNYSTIIPSKPPRRKSVNSLNDSQRVINASRSSPDLTQYEELEDDMDDSLQRDLHSGDVINKMKHRPLPPPPRPPRTLKKSKKKPPQPDTSNTADKFDHDDGGEEILAAIEIDILPHPPPPPKPEEIDMSTQTDAVEGEEDIDFMDDFEEELDEMVPELKPPNELRTLQEILEKEQEAELERARQLAEAKILDRGIQRFRESSQRNYSERSRASSGAGQKKTSNGSFHPSRSTSRPGSRPGSLHGGSRPMSPVAILIEKRTSTPSFDHGIPITEVKLTVQPIDLDDDIEDNEAMVDNLQVDAEIPIDDDEKVINLDVTIEKQEMDKFKGSDEILIQSGDDDEAINRNKDIEESPPPQPPVAPRRKKSSTVDSSDAKEEAEREVSTPPQILATVDEHAVVSQQIDTTQPSNRSVDRLQVSELDVDRLNVNALHANQIIVSELQSMAINTQDIACKSGDLAMRTIELPPGFIDEIVDRLSSQLHQHQQQLLEQQQQQQQQYQPIQSEPEIITHVETIMETPIRESSPLCEELPPPVPPPPSQIQKIEDDVEELLKMTEELIEKTESQDIQQETPPPPARPPPPDQSHFYQEFFPYSIPPPSFYQLRNPSDEEPSQEQPPPPHSPTQISKHRHRRHQRKHDSTSEEEYQQREQNRNARGGRPGTRSPEPSIPELGGQLIRACSTAVQRSCRQILTALRDGTTKEIENNNEFHVAIIIVIIIVAGLILFGMGQGNKTVHLHHWDYFNPPGSGSEQTQ